VLELPAAEAERQPAKLLDELAAAIASTRTGQAGSDLTHE
jgi:hypothetical protein